MRKLLLMTAALAMCFSSCETSEGIKAGILQKVSHKQFPCNYYAAEFAYAGGRISSSVDENGGASVSGGNSQEVTITKQAYDTLQMYVGYRVQFDYKDRGYAPCEESKILTSLNIMPGQAPVTQVTN